MGVEQESDIPEIPRGVWFKPLEHYDILSYKDNSDETSGKVIPLKIADIGQLELEVEWFKDKDLYNFKEGRKILYFDGVSDQAISAKAFDIKSHEEADETRLVDLVIFTSVENVRREWSWNLRFPSGRNIRVIYDKFDLCTPLSDFSDIISGEQFTEVVAPETQFVLGRIEMMFEFPEDE